MIVLPPYPIIATVQYQHMQGGSESAVAKALACCRVKKRSELSKRKRYCSCWLLRIWYFAIEKQDLAATSSFRVNIQSLDTAKGRLQGFSSSQAVFISTQIIDPTANICERLSNLNRLVLGARDYQENLPTETVDALLVLELIRHL